MWIEILGLIVIYNVGAYLYRMFRKQDLTGKTGSHLFKFNFVIQTFFFDFSFVVLVTGAGSGLGKRVNERSLDLLSFVIFFFVPIFSSRNPDKKIEIEIEKS